MYIIIHHITFGWLNQSTRVLGQFFRRVPSTRTFEYEYWVLSTRTSTQKSVLK